MELKNQYYSENYVESTARSYFNEYLNKLHVNFAFFHFDVCRWRVISDLAYLTMKNFAGAARVAGMVRLIAFIMIGVMVKGEKNRCSAVDR